MDGDFDLNVCRKRLVAKDNRLIQNSWNSLGLLETKAVLYMISKIQPTDEVGKIYVFNCREFQSLLNWNKEASYQNVKIMLQNLGDKSIWIEGEVQGRKKEMLVRWFNQVHTDPGDGNIEISFHQDMFPFLIDLRKRMAMNNSYFTTYMFQNVALMKHRYSPRIYELLKSYQYNNKKWTFENGTGSEFDLQRKIADTIMDNKTRKPIPQIPTGWKQWAIFKRNVLDPSIEEINKYTDIKVAYEGKKEDIHHKKTRAVRTIDFYMIGKTDLEQRRTERTIDAEYNFFENDGNCSQMTIEEMFFQAHKVSLEKQGKSKYIENHDQVNKSEYKVLFSELNEMRDANFDERKIGQLYDSAIHNRVDGKLSVGTWELFATDLVIYYYEKILATPEATKTNLYNRLLDSVKNDYDNLVSDLIEQYNR